MLQVQVQGAWHVPSHGRCSSHASKRAARMLHKIYDAHSSLGACVSRPEQQGTRGLTEDDMRLNQRHDC